MRKTIFIITICLLITVVFSGCTVLQKLGLQNSSDELRPASSIVLNEDEAKKLSDKIPIYLYFANENNRLRLEVRYIPVAEAKKSVNSLATTIVNELIKGPSQISGLKATIPAGTQLRSPVNVKSGVATVDFTKGFVDNHPGGKSAEQLTIFSIVNSLTEMKDIQKVKFTIEGKVKKEYKGNFQFDVPFPRSIALISKEAVPVPNTVPSDKLKDNTAKDSKNKDNTTKDNTTTEKNMPSDKGSGEKKSSEGDSGQDINVNGDIGGGAEGF